VLVLSLAVACLGAAESSDTFAKLVTRVLQEGNDASLNAAFAKVLGVGSGQSAVRLKRLKSDRGGVTNIFNVSIEDKQTVILSVREKNISTYFLTDTTGKLKKAIVNDGAIADGGMTNLPLSVAEPKFRAQKDFWSKSPAQR